MVEDGSLSGHAGRPFVTYQTYKLECVRNRQLLFRVAYYSMGVQLNFLFRLLMSI
jgi:hypothetical protein